MPKPDLPNSDSSSDPQSPETQSSETQSSDIKSGKEAKRHGFEWMFNADSLEDMTDTPDGPGTKKPNLQLFPMPGMTISRSEAMDAIAELTDNSDGQSQSALESQDAGDDDTALLNNHPVKNGTPVFQEVEPPSAPLEDLTNTPSSADSESPELMDVGAEEVASVAEESNAITTPQPQKKGFVAFKTLRQWGNNVASNRVVQRVTGFTGWPWAIALGVSGATTMSAFAWLAGLPPVPNCKIPSSSWSAAGRLYCADQAARQKEPKALASALDMVGDWDKDDPLYDQVNKLSDDWSRSILDVAQNELDQGKLNEAIKLAERVPKSSTFYDESRTTITAWQSNWKEGEKILEVARDAIQEQDWEVATDQLRQLVQLGGEHWQRRADKLISEMTIEQDAFRQLNVANDRAGYGTVSDVQSAIQLATKIDPKRLARKKLITYVDRWSEKLIDLADFHYESGDYETAIEAAEAVPPGAKVGDEAIAYLHASRAHAASEEDSPFGYIQAVSYASQIPKEAQVRDIAEEDIATWETQVQSWAQLEFAKLFVRIDQRAGYEVAINHAALVETDNPNRIAAQSLIAQWDKQLNSVEDRQTIARAAQLAKQTDLSSVQAAIAEARRVKVESPLRIRAQTLIAEWEGSIEKREDQPILDKAIQQAKQGDLYAAIETAEQIESNRALFDDAQDAIYGWRSDIQTAEDDPILDAAAALANQGRYSEAIAKASQVGYGRALYYEAQDLIGRWISARDQIEAARRPRQPEPSYDPEPYDEPEPYYEPEPSYSQSDAGNYVNNEPAPEEPYVEENYADDGGYVDSASGAGISGGPDF